MAELEELLAFELGLSDPEEVGETAREARIRQAVEQSKTYVAHREVPYWFAPPGQDRVEQMRSDRRAGPEVEWTIASLYARGEYGEALSLALRALRIQSLLPPVQEGGQGVLRAAVRKPTMPRLASKVNTREALDTALRSASKLVRDGASPLPALEDCTALLLLAKDEAMAWFPAHADEWDSALPPDPFPPPVRQEHWSAHPGLIASAAELSLALGRTVEAVGMCALSLAARPEQWRVWLLLLRALMALEVHSFARATACATCFSSPPSVRAQLAQTLLQRLRDAAALSPPGAVGAEQTLPYPIWYVLVHGAFAGRVREAAFLDPTACERKLRSYASSKGEGDTTEANFRSVRSL